jgi:hypothetical protein
MKGGTYMTGRVFTCMILHAGLTLALAQPAGGISGKVVDSSGNPVADAAVTYENLVPINRDSSGGPVFLGRRINSGTRTDGNGTFSISGLPDGTYLLCASGAIPTQLRSCEWAQLPTRVQVIRGATVGGVVMRLQDGIRLVFQISDPYNRIIDLADFPVVNGRLPLTGGNFRIGVMVGTRYVRGRLVARSNGMRQYSVAVPNGSVARVMVETSLQVQGVPSQPIPLTGPNTIQISIQ